MSSLATQLAALWQKNLPVVLGRVSLLDQAAASAQTLSPAERAEAQALAHKLAGALGMYGFPEGSRLARELEQRYESADDLDPVELQRITAQLRSVIAS